MLPKLIVIEGTNASGKSSLGVTLAERFGVTEDYVRKAAELYSQK